MSSAHGLRLAAESVSLERGGQAILKGANLAIAPGEIVGLVGPNGAGKSTLLRCLAGLVTPDRGTVTLGKRPLADLAHRDRARALGYLAQATEVAWPLTVEAIVRLGRLPHRPAFGATASSDRVAVAAAMRACEIETLADRIFHTLSGGERARVMLARALAAEPTVLLADEPVASLDPYHQIHVMELLGRAAAGGTGVLVVLHDLGLAARFCHRVAVMSEGRIAADGPPETVLQPDRLGGIYHVDIHRGQVAGETVFLAASRREGAE